MGSSDGMPLFAPLLDALTQCVCIIAFGYLLRRFRIFTSANVEGVSAYVARVALPALILLKVRAARAG